MYIFSYFMDYSLWKSDSCCYFNRIKTLFQIDSPCYFVSFLFRQHPDQNFISNFCWNIRLCLPLEKVIVGCFLKVSSYWCHYPWLLRSFSNVQYRMKKLRPCVKKAGPRDIFPSTHYTSMSQFCRLSFKWKLRYSGYYPKIKYTKGSNLQHSAI